MDWHLYILDCDGRYYTGIATDPVRRLAEHRARNSRAAKFTRSAQHHDLVFSIPLGKRGLALRAEARVKRLPRARKESIVRIAPSAAELLTLLGLDGQDTESST